MLPHTRSVLWIAAHPDDELLVAPLLAHLSFNCGVRTTMLVLTQGERGPCHLDDAPDVDLATVRAAELQASATLVGARGIGWTLADGSAGTVPGVIANWSGSASRTALATRIADTARDAAADLVLAFDPTHGSTGHADHLAAGELALDALRTMGSSAPSAFLVQSLVEFKPGANITFRNARPSDPRVISFDAHGHRTPDGASCWSYVSRAARLHRSQFDARWADAFDAVPPDAQRVHLLAAEHLADGRATRRAQHHSLSR